MSVFVRNIAVDANYHPVQTSQLVLTSQDFSISTLVQQLPSAKNLGKLRAFPDFWCIPSENERMSPNKKPPFEGIHMFVLKSGS